MDAKKKLILIGLVVVIPSFFLQTPIMMAVGSGMHTFINGRNVDCISCHGNGSTISHQAGFDAHQMAGENKNYTTYLEVGGISYDPAGIIYTNIDSDSNGTSDVWIWTGSKWVYNNTDRLYNLDFNYDGIIGGSETCKLCHNRELMKVSAQDGPEHTFSPRYCNDDRCHGNSNNDYRFNKTGYNTIPPASISNKGISTGNFYINNTWTNPTDEDFNYVRFNFSNGSALSKIYFPINYLNLNVSPHYVQNISAETVDIYGNVNRTKIWFNMTLPDNPPVLSPIGNQNVLAGSLLQFNVIAEDADNDPLTYGTNAIRGSLDPQTGFYSWQTTVDDTGEYVWYFDSNDNYGGIAVEIITVIVNRSLFIPSAPENLTAMQGNFWINHTWEPGTGNRTDSFNVSVNSLWTNGTSSTYNNTTVLPHGWSNITVWAYNNSGSGSLSISSVSQNTRLSNNIPVQSPIGSKTITAGDTLSFTVESADADTDPITYGTNASKGTLDPSTGDYSWPTTGLDEGTYTWSFNSSDNYGAVTSETITVTVTAQPVFEYIPEVPGTLQSSQGNFWINHTWEPGTGNNTDSFNVSVNSLWTNGTASTYNNTSVLPHGWSNITVWAYNNSGSGSQSISSVSQNTRLSNNFPVQSPIGSKTITAGDTLNFTVESADADTDPITYGTNASKGTLDPSTGDYSWPTSGLDEGTYTWSFSSSDNYGGIASETIIVTVTAQPIFEYIPEVPGTLQSSQGNFWINHTWEPGTGNKTDSFNVSVNSLWTNGTASTYNNTTVLPHGWSNITVWSYNNSGSGSLSSTPVSQNTRLSNNPPVQSPISSKTITAGDTLNFTVAAEDADTDPITYGTNASKGTLDPSTGDYSWPTSGLDEGTYIWSFNSSDNYGGIASETITVTVTAQPVFEYIPEVPGTLQSSQGNFWINHTWEPGTGNRTDSFNVNVNSLWTNGTASTYNNTTVLPHGWSNITVWAYNNSGSGSLSSTPAAQTTRLSNNIPVQSPIGSKTITAGDTLSFTVEAADADTDPITYGTNASKGTLDPSTGDYSWPTTGLDEGIYTWSFNSSDNYGGIDTETIIVTVTAQPVFEYIPEVPGTLQSSQGNFWINHTWEPGTGNNTDSFNVNVNSLWTNGTASTYNNTTVLPHGWSNITVWAYNNSGSGSLSISSVSQTTRLSNNPPVQNPIGGKTITAGDTLNFTVESADADTDPITYGTNASKGTLDPSTGDYSWTTSGLDEGTYTWYFSSSDNYGGVDTETITVTVNAAASGSQTVTLAANSTENSGFSAQTTGENLYNNTVSNSQVGTRTSLSTNSLNALSFDDTSYVNRTGSNSVDAIMVVNFTLSNVQSVNWVSLKFVGTVTTTSEPLTIGLYNATSPSGGGWTKLNSTTPAVGTYTTITYNVTSQTEMDTYLVLNGNTLTFSFAEWVNGASNSGLRNDLYEATVNYQ